VKGIGAFLHRIGQLPVHRGHADAALALKEAEKRLTQSATVIIYPEGTATRDPRLWPMAAKTGAASARPGHRRALRAATDVIMAEVTALVGQLRGQIPPAVPYDPKNPVPTTGNAVSDPPGLPRPPETAMSAEPSGDESHPT
jgi:1-acyl-sn-glycerol-3-phosphate acyltransferase